jgi:thiamine-monophosphate kinase
MNKDEEKLTELSSLGEFGLIDHLTRNIPLNHTSTIKGVGDDAAVIKPADDKVMLLSKDLLIEGVHFDLTYMPLKHLGYKSAVVNFSDMVAMNGLPTQIIVGLGISSKFSVEALDEMYEGIKKACELYKVDFVGGDTTSSVAGLFISVTVVGEANQNRVTYRNGAGVNDLLCVSGDLGGAYMGLLVLEREKQVFKANPNMQPDLTQHNYILERQLKPEARIDIVRTLDEKGIVPTAMIDISDGLASEALHICKASKKGCMVYEEKLPIDQNTYDTAKEFNIIPSVAALNGGEDYELLFTIKQEDYEKVKDIEGVTIIGHITDETDGEKLVSNDNHLFNLEAQGWDALKKRELDKLTTPKNKPE